jgi:hypothetical protein
MKLKRWHRLLLIMTALVAVTSLMIWGYLSGREEMLAEQEGEQLIRMTPRVGGNDVITLDQNVRLRSGIIAVPLESVSYHQKTMVVIPSSAVVWLNNKAWIYVQKDEDHFVRGAVSTEEPFKDGWLVEKNTIDGNKIIISGAQLLLSEEFRSQIPVGEEGNK